MGKSKGIIAAVLVAIGALLYGASPIDIIPELLTGPLGLADDLAVFVAAGFGIWKLLSNKGTPPATDTIVVPPSSPTPPPE